MLPEKFKKYYCYDDGKIYLSRQYKVLITDIIPWDEADLDLKCLCNSAIIESFDLYKNSQEYIIIGVSYEGSIPTIEIFLETHKGECFGIGDYDDF